MLEQLLFACGPQGAGVVAASQGLVDRHEPLHRLAVRYCRYTRPSGLDDPEHAPVSYGWANEGPHRVVFRRAYLGQERWCAHVVVGPASELPVTELVRRFESPFWWRGVVAPNRLTRTSLADMPTMKREQLKPGELARFTETVFGAQGRVPVVLQEQPKTVIGLVAALSERVPGALERLSVSTYEELDSAAEFDVVGTGGWARVPAGSVIARHEAAAVRARRVALSGLPEDRHVVAIALALAGTELPSVVAGLATFADLPNGRTIDPGLLAQILAEPRATSALLHLTAGRAAAVDALVAAHADAWNALFGSAPRVPSGQLEAFAAELGRAALDSPDRRATAFVLTQSRRMPRHFTAALAHAVVRAAVGRIEQLQRLDAWGTVTLLDACRKRNDGNDYAAIVAALLDTTPAICLAVADAGLLPPSWRARALANRTALALDDAAPVVQRLDECPELIEYYVRALPSAEMLGVALAQAEPAVAGRVALRAAKSVSRLVRADMLSTTAARLPPADRFTFAERALAGGPHPELDTFAAGLASDAVARKDLDPALWRILRLTEGPESVRWLRILDALDDPPTSLPLAAGLDEGATELILHRLLQRDPDTAALTTAAERSGLPPARTTRIILTTAPESAALPVVTYLLEAVQAGRLPLGRNGLLPDPLQHRARIMIDALAPDDRRTATRRALYYGGPANRWWKATRRR